jgi:hypothetical protein
MEKKIAYAKENNLYVYDLASKSTIQITMTEEKMPSLMVLRTGFMKNLLL